MRRPTISTLAMPVTSTSWPDRCATRMQLGRPVPRDEERHPRLPRVVVEAGASPTELGRRRDGSATPGSTSRPSRAAVAVEIGVGHAHREPAVDAVGGARPAAARPSAVVRPTRGRPPDQLEVVRRPAARCGSRSPSQDAPPGHRRQPVRRDAAVHPPRRDRRRRARRDRSSACDLLPRPATRNLRDELAIPSEHAPAPVSLCRHRRARAARLGRRTPPHDPQPLLEGLTFPTNMAFLPDGTLLFTEKETGNVRIVTSDGELVDPPFIDGLGRCPSAERGLLGIAVHPTSSRTRGSTSTTPTPPMA